MRLARYYRTARTVHLERLASFYPGELLYQSTMYDFDLTQLPDGASAKRVRFADVLRIVWRREVDFLELAEPYAPSAIPQNLALSVARRISSLIHGDSVRFTAYAIENADLPSKYAAQWHVPLFVMRAIFKLSVGFIYRSFDRIVFGTEDAKRNYIALIRSSVRRASPATRVIEGLPVAREMTSPASRLPILIFLGAFDHRKGVMRVIDAWEIANAHLPGARLVVMGKGPLEERVVARLARDERAELIVDPSRDRIWDVLESGTALCLLSQPANGWKEQIGLPIVEGLSAGLEIIATTETGIAQWLEAHGHRVVSPSIAPDDLALVMKAVMSSSRDRSEITSHLPAIDGRLAADRWLHSHG